MKMVKATWIDSAFGRHGWESKKHYANIEPQTCTTVGFLVKRSASKVIIALNTDQHGDVADCMVIPRKNIKKLEYLKPIVSIPK